MEQYKLVFQVGSDMASGKYEVLKFFNNRIEAIYHMDKFIDIYRIENQIDHVFMEENECTTRHNDGVLVKLKVINCKTEELDNRILIMSN